MTTATEEALPTASVTTEREWRLSGRAQEVNVNRRWPWFKIGSALSPSAFAEDAELVVLPDGWSTNVVERPLFAGQFLELEREPSLWERLASLRSMIPEEERGWLPADAAQNIDEYL